MIKVLLLFLFIQTPNETVKQAKSNEPSRRELYVTKLVHDTILIVKRDTVYIKNVSEPASNGSDYSKNMPWIVAFMVAVIAAGVNLFVAKKLRDANRKAIEDQMATLKENNIRDFNKTVISASRQAWITSFRDIISEVITLISIFELKASLQEMENHKLQLLINKAQLMLIGLNGGASLSSSLEELRSCCFGVLMQTKTIEELEKPLQDIRSKTSLLLNSEWEKASRGQ